MMEKNGIWVFCENGPQGVREVSYELLGAAARLAKNAGTRVVAVALGAGVPVEELCARGADEVLLVEDAALDAPEAVSYTHLDVYKRQMSFHGVSPGSGPWRMARTRAS